MTDGAAPMSRTAAAELLGVPADADPAEVQRAFLRAARHVHPDTLPDADDAEHRIASDAFGRLLRAREVLLAPAAAARAEGPPGFTEDRGDPDGPRYRVAERRGLGGSLVVLALLAFLLVAIVTAQQGLQPQPFESPSAPPAASRAP